jgi:tetratricopeptide (TPR) repeat protein
MKLLAIAIAALTAAAPAARAADMDADLSALGHQWAAIYYKLSDSQQEAAYPALIGRAEAIVRQYPAKAEPMIWETIILSCYAKAKGGLGAIDVARHARELALQAAKVDDRAMEAGAYTALGALYYKVPGWPIGFGNDKTAKAYLDKAVAIAPQAMDANYFAGDFMIEQGDKTHARDFLERALRAPSHPGHEDADAGRRIEIEQDLAKLGG